MKSLFILFSILSCIQVIGQTVLMSNQSVIQCGGNLYDSGGAGTNNASQYQNNEHYVLTICPQTNQSVQLNFTEFDVDPSDFLTIYDGNSTSAPIVGTYNNDDFLTGIIQATVDNSTGCLTLEFVSNGSARALGWKAELNCVYPCQQILTTETFSLPNQSEPYKLCQNNSLQMNGHVTFPENNTFYNQTFNNISSFWIVEGPNQVDTLTGANVTKLFNEQGVYAAYFQVIDSNGCKSTQLEKKYIYVSTTPIFSDFTLQNDTICLGQQNILSVAPTFVMESFNCVPDIGDTTFLPDGDGNVYQTAINVNCFQANETIDELSDLQSICLNIEHSYIGDLQIDITCPNGTEIELLSYQGESQNTSGQHLGIPIDNDGNLNPGVGLDYCFTMTAPESFNEYCGHEFGNVTLPTGDYLPVDDFSLLMGCPVNGTWTITVTDNLESDNGYIFGWGISFGSTVQSEEDHSFTPTLDSEIWVSNPDIISQQNETITVQPTSIGQHCYTYSLVDDFGCSYDTTLCFSVIGSTGINEDTTVCEGSLVTFALNGMQNVIWNNGSTQSNIAIQADSSMTLSYSGLTTSGCPVQGSILVSVEDSPTIEIQGSSELCVGSSSTLTASGATSYSWNTGQNTAALTISPTQTTTYTVTGASENGCIQSENFTITVNELPFVSAGLDTTICSGNAIILTANSENDVSWIGGYNNGSPIVPTSIGSNLYICQVVDEQGCINSDTIEVTVLEAPIILFNVNTLIGNPVFEFQVTDNTTNADQLVWDFGNGNTYLTESTSFYNEIYSELGSYLVSIVASNPWCVVDSSFTIHVVPYIPFTYEIPNIFTPNGDGLNDVYFIETFEAKELQAYIVNRWGNQVATINGIYNPSDTKTYWDGKNNRGEEASEGVYFITYTIVGKENQLVKGQSFIQLKKQE